MAGRGRAGLAGVGRVLQGEDDVLATSHLACDEQRTPHDADLLEMCVLRVILHGHLDRPIVADHAVRVHDLTGPVGKTGGHDLFVWFFLFKRFLFFLLSYPLTEVGKQRNISDLHVDINIMLIRAQGKGGSEKESSTCISDLFSIEEHA